MPYPYLATTCFLFLEFMYFLYNLSLSIWHKRQYSFTHYTKIKTEVHFNSPELRLILKNLKDHFRPHTSLYRLQMVFITFHSIVRESFTELIDHNEGNTNWIVSPT